MSYVRRKTPFLWFVLLFFCISMMNSWNTFASDKETDETTVSSTIYEIIQWNAEEYFSNNSKGIALCNAIEEMNIQKIDQILDSGVDVNMKGNDNMTPLMWSLASNFETFEHLLKRGANPNVVYMGEEKIIHRNEGSNDGIVEKFGLAYPRLHELKELSCGISVVDIVSCFPDSRWLKTTLENGGDPNIVFFWSPIEFAARYA